MLGEVRPLPGARELLAQLTARGVPWAIATSGWLRAPGRRWNAGRRRRTRR